MATQEMKFKKQSLDALEAHTDLMKLHFKALACHCEVMGMMSENMLSAVEGSKPMFGMLHFIGVMTKWGLTNEKGEPVI